jgi:hypothetical protein
MGTLGEKRRQWPHTAMIVVRGRRFSQADLVELRRLIRRHPSWGRTRISIAACELLSWKQANGRSKERACRVALLKLESLGLLKLPKRILNRGGQPPRAQPSTSLLTIAPLHGMPQTVSCRLVSAPFQRRLWNALIADYHYLGLGTPVGRLVRYLLYGDDCLIGAISFTDAAWSLAARDAFLSALPASHSIGRNSVINNNRFLILPSARIPNLASRALALSLRTVREDWQALYHVEPKLAETFVDPTRYEGTCYRAANWIALGRTKGFSKHGSQHIDKRHPKIIFLRGLTPGTHRIIHRIASANRLRAA